MFEFPVQATLLNTFAGGTYFPMVYKGDASVSKTVKMDTKGKVGPVKGLGITLETYVCDAIFLAAPYVRIVSPSSPKILRKHLKDARLSLVIDREILIPDAPLLNHLVDPEGIVPEMAWPDLSHGQNLFLAAHPRANGSKEWDAIGYFLSSGADVNVEIRCLPSGRGVLEIETGLVAATYTTRVEKGTPGPRTTKLRERVLHLAKAK
jgi:hypothetical protein